MTHKKDPKQIIDLPLIPVRPIKQPRNTRDGVRLIRIRLDPYPRVMPHAQHVVDDFKALIPRRVVDGGDIGDHGELGGGMVAEKGKDRDDASRRNVDCEFIFPDGKLLYVAWKAGEKVLAVGVEALGLVGGFVGWIDDWGVELALRVARCFLVKGQSAFWLGQRRDIGLHTRRSGYSVAES